MEEWKQLEGLDGLFEVSSYGRMRRQAYEVPTGRGGVRTIKAKLLKPIVKNNGYFTYEISFKGQMFRKTAHSLVLEVFVGPRPPGMYVCHNDGNKLNNRLANLRYDTPFGNSADKKIHGTQYSGSGIWCAKLTVDQVVSIRNRRALGEKLADLAVEFGIAETVVWKITTGKTWKDASGPITKHGICKFLKEEEVKQVIADRAAGLSIRELADKYQLSRNQIHRVVK